ncbi:MAG: diguanylate cyclase domain-containing protein, partial [Lachnotalea sp.]
MENKLNNKKISIRNIIIITFLVNIIFATLIIGKIVFSKWLSSTNEITKNMSANINLEISNKINEFLNSSKHVNEVNERIIKNGIVDLSNEEERNKYFAGVLQTHQNEIYSFTYGLDNGNYYGARRNEEGNIEVVKNDTDTDGCSWYYSMDENLLKEDLVFQTQKFDARTRDWYKAAKMQKVTTFSPVYKHFVMDDLTISSATPIYDNEGDLQGVLGTHMILSTINDNIYDMIKDYNGYAVVMEKNSNLLIANSFGGINFTIADDGSIKRNTINDLNNTLISAMFNQYNTEDTDNFLFKSGNKGYYVNVINYQNEGLDWIIISAISSDLFTNQIYYNMKITIFSIFITILLFSIFYYIAIKKIFRPVDGLVLAAKEIALGNFSQRALVIRNDEIGKLSIAFNFMADKMFQFVNNLEEIVKERTKELELANEEINKTKEDLYLILDTTAEGIFGIDMTGKLIFCNDSCIEILGYQTQEEILGKNMQSLIYDSLSECNKTMEASYKILNSLTAGEKLYISDESFLKSDGTKIDVEYHSYPKLKDSIITGAVVTFIDITEKKKGEEQINYLSCHDSLTGLINRRCFENNLMIVDTISSLPISIIFGDLNGLKLTNDVFGHKAGDILIQRTAEVLLKVCRVNDIVARIGGDEFIIILPKTDAKMTRKIIQRIKEELAKEIVYGVKCNIALGFDTKTEFEQDIEKIMGNAEAQMYKDKLLSKRDYGTDTIETIMKTLQDRNPIEKEHSQKVAVLC